MLLQDTCIDSCRGGTNSTKYGIVRLQAIDTVGADMGLWQQRGPWWLPAAVAAALATSGARVWERLSTLLDASEDEWRALVCAMTSITDSLDAFGKCGPAVPTKWVDLAFAAALAFAATMLVLVAWSWTCSGGTTHSACPATPGLAAVVLLHGGWLVAHAVLDRTYVKYFGERYLCTWCWWGTAAYAAIRVTEALRHADAPGGYRPAASPGLSLTCVVYACELSRLVWVYLAFFTIPHNLTSTLLHLAPIAYMVLALVLDERRRPPLPAGDARRTALSAAALALAGIGYSYGWIYDYRDVYSMYFAEDGTVPDSWPVVVQVLSCSFAALAALATYDIRGRRPSWPRLAAMAAVAAAVPVSLLCAWPNALYDDACPHRPVRVDVAAGAWPTSLAADLTSPVYVHAIVSPDHATLAIELAALEHHLLRHSLYPPCRGRLRLPDLQGDGMWVWALSLRRAADKARRLVVTPDRSLRRVGSVLLLLVVDRVGQAPAIALAARAPSVTLLSGTDAHIALERVGNTTRRHSVVWCNDALDPSDERACASDVDLAAQRIVVVDDRNVLRASDVQLAPPLARCAAANPKGPSCLQQYFGGAPLAAAHAVDGKPLPVDAVVDYFRDVVV